MGLCHAGGGGVSGGGYQVRWIDALCRAHIDNLGRWMVSTLETNLDMGIVEVLELIGDLSNVSEMDFKWGEVVIVIGMCSLLSGVGEVLEVLSGRLAVP